MTFHIFAREQRDGHDVLHLTGDQFRLAGHNLLYRAWVNRDKPILQGWSVSADELIRLCSDEADSYATRRLIVDYLPSNMTRIPLVEIQEIFLFNWGGQAQGSVDWTPMMLRMRDVRDEWSGVPISKEERSARMAELEIDAYGTDFVEFLYLQGDNGGWNWGRSGATNGTFLHGQARDYFRQFL